MNGARAEPCANTSSAPTNNITTRIGSSHHFFRTRINVQSSAARLVRFMTTLLELALHIGAVPGIRGSGDPSAPSRSRVPKRSASEKAHQQSHGCEHNEVDDP